MKYNLATYGICFATLFILNAEAATIPWTGSVDEDLATAANWAGGVEPGPADTAVFQLGPTNISPTLVTPGSAFLVTNIDFPGGAPSYHFTIGHAGMTIVNDVTNASGAMQTFTLLNGGNLSVSGSADSTNSGLITYDTASGSNAAFSGNTGRALFNISGSLYLNATTGNGIVTLTNHGVLNVDQASSIGSLADDGTGGLQLAAQLTVGSANTSTSFGGSILGPNAIIKDGTGTFTLSGANALTYGGTTTAAAGTLTITGSVGGNVDVSAGATLTNGGGLAGGNYNPASGSIYLVNAVNHMTFGGLGNLAGEVVVADVPLPTNTTFEILGTGGLVGRFAGATSLNPSYRPVLSYDPFNVYLTLFPNFATSGLTPNQRAVATNLNSITVASPALTPLIDALSMLSGPAYTSALDQLSGVQYANLIQLSEMTGRRFLRRIYDPFRQDFACPCQKYCCEEIETWVSVQGGQSFLNSDYNARGFKLYDASVSGGIHRYMSACFALGVAGNYEYDSVEFYQGGKGINNNFQGGVYGIYEGSWTYLFGEIIGGASDWNIHRPLAFGTFVANANSHGNVNQVVTYGELGLNLNENNCWLVQPFIGLEYGHYWRSRFKENGAGAANLIVREQEIDDFETRLGGHFTTTWRGFVLSADADWRHRYTKLGDSLTIDFIDFGGDMTIVGAHQNKDAFEGELFISTPVCCGTFLSLEGFGEVWSRYYNYGASLTLQKVW